MARHCGNTALRRNRIAASTAAKRYAARKRGSPKTRRVRTPRDRTLLGVSATQPAEVRATQSNLTRVKRAKIRNAWERAQSESRPVPWETPDAVVDSNLGGCCKVGDHLSRYRLVRLRHHHPRVYVPRRD